MDRLLARYLDGELTEEEAASLLDAARKDPSLEAELRQYEALLTAAARIEQGVGPPGNFADEVMGRVRGEAAVDHVPSRLERFRWRTLFALKPAVAVAAALAIFYTSGYLTGRLHLGSAGPEGGSVSDRLLPGYTSSVTWISPVPGEENLRILRLVYLPSHSGVGEVTVAGSFNRWDPTATPMRKEGNVWSAVLVLPVGSYEYMFVEDEDRWVEDPLAPQKRDDGFGGSNAVLDLTT